MEQRDIIKDQIEQFGKVLAHILSDFLGLKSQGQSAQGMELTSLRLQNELDIDVDKLLTLKKAELVNYILSRNIRSEHLETLSEYLKEVGIEEILMNKSKAKLCIEKSIELLDIADEISKTASFDRMNMKANLENVLQENF